MSLARAPITGITAASIATLGNSLTLVGSSSAITISPSGNIVDHEVTVAVGVGAITASSSTVVNVFVAGSIDGTTWPGNATGNEVLGTDASVTLSTNGNNLIFLGQIACHTASIVTKSKPLSIAAAFGGSLPAKYAVIVQNQTSLALTSAVVAAQELSYT